MTMMNDGDGGWFGYTSTSFHIAVSWEETLSDSDLTYGLLDWIGGLAMSKGESVVFCFKYFPCKTISC